MICHIVRLSICPLWLVSGFVGLEIKNISFSARLSVHWGRRIESYFLSENCALLHCPPFDLSFEVCEWIRIFGDNKYIFSARLSVRWGRRVESYFHGENCEYITMSARASVLWGLRVDS